VATSQSGLAFKLEKISLRSQSSTRIHRSNNRFIKNGDITLSETKVAGIKQKCSNLLDKENVSIQELASLIGTLNATVEAVIPASLYVLKRVANVPD
jgi:hypothetical protein